MNLEAAGDIERRIQNRDSTLDEQTEVAEAVQVLCAYWLGHLKGVVMEGQQGAPDWRGFELRTWELGESLRLFLRKKKQWRGRGPLLDVTANLVLNPDFGKGRQTHALLLGDFGERDYGEVLGRVLSDREIWGHVIKALTKAGLPGYAAEIAAIQEQESGWIRNAAKKYLQNLGDQGRSAP